MDFFLYFSGFISTDFTSAANLTLETNYRRSNLDRKCLQTCSSFFNGRVTGFDSLWLEKSAFLRLPLPECYSGVVPQKPAV